MTDSLSPVEQQVLPASIGMHALPMLGPTGEQLASLRLRLLQAEEQLRSGQWLEAERCLLTARTLLERSEAPPAPMLPRGGLTLRQRQRVQVYIEKNISRSIRVCELSQLLGLSYSHFCRVFRQGFGQPPMTYVRTRRVARAKELMVTSRVPLSRIALECGLSDQAALCKLFRRATGATPSVWRGAQRE